MKILIVEDSPTQSVQIRLMVEEAGYKVQCASNGVEAMASIAADPPQIVLTDLHMPEMSGLELVEAVRKKNSSIPVVLMTADGTEDIAAQALRAGATSYIPKRGLERDLPTTLADIASMIERRRDGEHVMNAVVESETTFEFGNDHNFASALVAHLESDLRQLRYDDSTGVFRIVLALKEAVMNAIDHGNLELDSKLRDHPDDEYQRLGTERKQQAPYVDRRIRLSSHISPTQVTYVIRDQGPGFDPSLIPDPTDPENLIRSHGRGLMLIQNFMDEVHHNETGNEITLIKYRNSADELTDTMNSTSTH